MTVHDAQRAALDATPSSGGSARIQSVERAAAILRAVAAASGSAASASALAEVVGLNRTTTWRILNTLEQQRLVNLDRDSGRYSLGFGLIDLAGQAGGASLVRSARPVLQRIATKTRETAALAVVRNGALAYAAEVTSGAVVAAGWQGRQIPVHATSTGKALAAWSEAADLRVLVNLPRGGRLPRFTSATITSLTALTDELAVTRERGYAVCRGEFEDSAWGVSAPVLDAAGRPVAVVSVWGPSERVSEERFEELGAVVVAGAEEIAQRRTAAQG